MKITFESVISTKTMDLSNSGIDGELKEVLEKEQQKMMFQSQVIFVFFNTKLFELLIYFLCVIR